MSWFADLAGKAEDFLNKVDQGAATALAKNQDGSPYEATVNSQYNIEGYTTEAAVTQHAHGSSATALSYISAAAGNIKKSNVTVLAGTANITSKPEGISDSGSSPTISAKVLSGFVRPKKEKDLDDDLLFDFLNSSDPLVSNKGDSKREGIKVAVPSTQSKNATPPPPSTPQVIPSVPSTPPSTHGISRTSSMSSLSAHSIKTESSAKELSHGTVINNILLIPYAIICLYTCNFFETLYYYHFLFLHSYHRHT